MTKPNDDGSTNDDAANNNPTENNSSANNNTSNNTSDSGDTSEKKSSGCFSSVSGIALIVPLCGAAALLMRKKKEQ